MSAAAWSENVPTRSVDSDGVATTVIELSDGGVPQWAVTVTATPQRELTVMVDVAEGAAPPADFQAWSSV